MPINPRPIQKNNDNDWTPVDLFAEPRSRDTQKPVSDNDAWTVVDLFAEPEEPAGRTIGGTVKDIGISVAKGVVGLGEAAVGLADIPTFGIVGKTMEGYLGYDPKKTQEFLSEFYSPEQKRAFGEVEQAVGFLGTIKESLKHPSTIGHAAVESFPLMLGGAAAARGLLAIGMKSPLLAGAIGEGIVSAGAAAEQTRQQTEDGLLTVKQALISAISGSGTAMFSLVGGRVAQKLGLVDVDTFLAGGSNVTSTGVIKRIIGGGISEGAFEELPQSMQEQVWLNAALDKPLMDGVAEAGATGMLAGAAMGAGFNIYTRRIDEAPPTARDELLEDYEKDATAKEILTGREEAKRVRAEALEAEEAAAVFEEEAIEREVIPEEKPIRPKEEAIEDDKEKERRLARIEREREEPGRPIPEPVPSREEIEAGRILEEAADEAREIKPEVAKKEPIKFVGTRETAKGEFPIFEDKSGFQIDYKPAEHEISNVTEYEAAKPRLAEEPKVEKPKVAEKEPWEMAKDEFDKTITEKRFSEDIPKAERPILAVKAEGKVYTDEKARLHADIMEQVPEEVDLTGLETGWVIDGKFQYQLPKIHKELVKKAISEGKPVPKEVLAEYPDLAPAKPIIPKPPKPTPPEAVEKEIKVEPIPKVEPKEAMTYEKGITLKRAQEITGDKSPSIAQIRDAFDKMAEAEQKSVINNVRSELKEEEAEKKEILKLRKEAFVPDKPIYTERLKTTNKAIERRKRQLQDFINRAKPIPKVAPKPKKEPKVEVPVEKAPTKPEPSEASI